jgi:hypothetical protein
MNLMIEYIPKEEGLWPLVYYSPSLNVVITTILKNGSSAVESWVKEKDFHLVSYNNKSLFNNNTKLITAIRDPYERALSAINMLQTQYKRCGLSVTYENFTNLHLAYEPHVMPQSCFIPVMSVSKNINCDRLWDTKHNNEYKDWNEVLESYNVFDSLTDQHIFFYIYENQDIIKPISKYLDIPYTHSYYGNNKADLYNANKPSVSESYKNYLKEVYRYDYTLIDKIKFINR